MLYYIVSKSPMSMSPIFLLRAHRKHGQLEYGQGHVLRMLLGYETTFHQTAPSRQTRSQGNRKSISLHSLREAVIFETNTRGEGSIPLGEGSNSTYAIVIAKYTRQHLIWINLTLLIAMNLTPCTFSKTLI